MSSSLPPSQVFDAIVLGCGAFGSAVARELARRGRRVLVLEQHDVPHELGSSHGSSRVIRKAYFEDARYVPLLHRAYDLWRQIETEAGETLMHLVGVLNVGPVQQAGIAGVRDSVARHALPHEVLSSAEIGRRFPGLLPAAGDVGIFEPDGGFLLPERCVIAMVEAAVRHGAAVRARERVLRVDRDGDPLAVVTDRGSYAARALVVTAGPWLPALLPALGLDLPLLVERQVQLWFAPRVAELYEPSRFPAFIHFTGERAYYGLPHFGRPGVKICRHHGGASTTADGVDRTVTRVDEEDVRGYLAAHAPLADGPLLAAKVCLYTNTPDGHFLLGRHPGDARLVLAGGCSGHGFKFAPVIGEVVADLLLEGDARFDLSMFEPDRFARRA